jgi:hypothetical protein
MTRIRTNVTVVLMRYDYNQSFNPKERDRFGGLDVAFVGFYQLDIKSLGSIKRRRISRPV